MDLSPVELLHPATEPRLAAELLTLQVAAYRVEAALIGSDPATLVAAGPSRLGCRDGEGLLGAGAITETTEMIGIGPSMTVTTDSAQATHDEDQRFHLEELVGTR